MNWGKGIVIALAAFIIFILSMVVQMYQKNIDLVEPNFYEQGNKIDSRVDATENALLFENQFTVTQNQDNVTINFPEGIDMNKAKGLIHFYRPEKASLDRKYPLKATEDSQVIDKKDLAMGNFIVKVEFQAGNKEYYIEKKIFVKK